MRDKKKIEIEAKVLKVVESCTTIQHLQSAEKYLVLYYELFEDLQFYRKAIEIYNQKIDQIRAS